jgi:hypothetical protein
MKATRQLSLLTLLLAFAASPCLADWGIESVSKERAKELGLEIRAKVSGPTQISVELEFKIEGALKSFSREGSGRIELQVKDGETCLASATLKEDRSKPGRVVVNVIVDRAHLNMIALRVWVPGVLGGDIYELRIKDFVELERIR